MQRMSTAPNRLKMYEPLYTRDFVDFSEYGQISISNIKEACEKFYDQAPGTCDVLLGDRGPSSTSLSRLPTKRSILYAVLKVE